MSFRPRSTWPLVLCGLLLSSATAFAQKPMTLDARLSSPVMKSGEKQKNYLRIAINGCEPERKEDRPPVNVALVIDRSGSMQGPRIAQAREAAIFAVNRLTNSDIASVVIFDDKVDVLVSAQNVSDRQKFIDRIRQVGARGQTAIYGGVNEGASEVRKNKDPRRLNRVVLLSDGLANVGPSRPVEFAELGRQLLGEGISVSTIGLGANYNEDLMLQLARASDGNHVFAGEATDLVKIFNREFDDVLGSCAQMVSIDVDLAPGVRAVRALSRDGSIDGGRAQFKLNQVYAATEHYVLLEVEVDGKPPAAEQDLGRVRIAYTVPQTGAQQALDASIRGRFSASKDEVAASLDKGVAEVVIEQTARARAQQAVSLRDQGRRDEATKLFQQNADEIKEYLAKSGKPSAVLQELQGQYSGFAVGAASAAPSAWNVQRKLLRELESGNARARQRY